MRILLLQLSDIHFTSAAKRPFKIKEAVMGKFLSADACFLAVSGDIANTGAPEEYEVARTFFTDLRSALLIGGIPRVEVTMIPGNHDCNLRNQNDTRTFLHINIALTNITAPITTTMLQPRMTFISAPTILETEVI
jgi:3',5'-cyclic AMP phosphodiesterase CpdA